jgi:hypothetical protein
VGRPRRVCAHQRCIRPTGASRRPAGNEPRPAGDEPRPAGDQPRPTGDQPRPAGDQPRPAGGGGKRPGGHDRPKDRPKRRRADVTTGRRTSRCQGRGIGIERTNGWRTPGEVRSQRGGPGIGTERTSRRRTPGEVSCGGAVPGRDRPDERPVAAGAAREPQGPGPGGRDRPDERPVAWPRGDRDRSGDRVRDGSERGAACAADYGTGAARDRHRHARHPRWAPAEARWDGAPRGRRPAWLRAGAARDGYGTWAAPAWCPVLGPPDVATAPPPARGGDRHAGRP